MTSLQIGRIRANIRISADGASLELIDYDRAAGDLAYILAELALAEAEIEQLKNERPPSNPGSRAPNGQTHSGSESTRHRTE